MEKINWGRVILGGLVAGVVINIVEFVLYGVILMDEWQAAMAALGKAEQAEGMWVYMVYILMGFAFGLLALWVYAAIRPRVGPGPKAAICAGLTVWALAYLMPTIGFLPSGLFPAGLMFTGVAVGVVEVPLATVIGAWLYREE